MKKINLLLITVSLIVLATSCKKSGGSGIRPANDTTGLYVLAQGVFGTNTTTLTAYDFGTGVATTDTFAKANGFKLGDTGSDFIIYGGKIYIVMNNSGYVAVANASSAKFIDSISFLSGSVNRGPENIVSAGGKVFVSSTDNTVSVIDTATLAITKTITVGTNPAQMVVSGTNLYVSNTGGFAAFSPPYLYDSTVSVIDLSTETETSKIVVGANPGYIAADGAGYVYVACTGDYNTILPSLVKVNTGTNTITKSVSIAAGVVRYYNNKLYTTGGGAGAPGVQVINTSDLSVSSTSFITDGTIITTPYGLDIDEVTGDVYIGDAKDYSAAGTVYCFDNTGTKKFSFSVTPTASPIKVVLLQQ
jgi:YVTN family beta-propeller protein